MGAGRDLGVYLASDTCPSCGGFWRKFVFEDRTSGAEPPEVCETCEELRSMLPSGPGAPISKVVIRDAQRTDGVDVSGYFGAMGGGPPLSEDIPSWQLSDEEENDAD
jgi:hypothetical protein